MPTRMSGRRAYRQDELVVLPPVEVPLDPEHERRALIALADLLAPLFTRESLAAVDGERATGAALTSDHRR